MPSQRNSGLARKDSRSGNLLGTSKFRTSSKFSVDLHHSMIEPKLATFSITTKATTTTRIECSVRIVVLSFVDRKDYCIGVAVSHIVKVPITTSGLQDRSRLIATN